MTQKRIEGLVVDVPGKDLKALFLRNVEELRNAVGEGEKRALSREKKRAALADAGIGEHTQDHVLDHRAHLRPGGFMDQAPEDLIASLKSAADFFQQYAGYIEVDAVYVLSPDDYMSIARMGPINMVRGMQMALDAPACL